MTKIEIMNEIATLESCDREHVATDAGTHGKPEANHVYETITGERYATYAFGGANEGGRYAESEITTPGRMRVLTGNLERMRGQQARLRELKNLARKAK